MIRPESDWRQVRLHVVTGKGGTGKTTVAAALAIALATDGGRVLLMEVEGRQGIAPVFDVPHLPYEERKVATAPGGGEVLALAVDAEAALLEYLDIFYHLGGAGRVLRKVGAVDFATTVAPGLRDVLLSGKAYEAVRRRAGNGRPCYDAVVLDAPPTGRIRQFLSVNTEVAGLARVGPIRSQADSIMTLLRSSATAVHLVTVLEEMPVQETADGVAELRGAGLPVGAVVVNMSRPQELDGSGLAGTGSAEADLTRALKWAGIEPTDQVVDALLTEAEEHAVRRNLEEQERETLRNLERPTYELPLVPDGIDVGVVYDLADRLRDQGAA